MTNRTLLGSAIRHVEPGSRIDTDDFSSYRLLAEIYVHRSVDHEEAYLSEEGTHCDSAEGEWLIYKPGWRGFTGVAKRNAYRYLSEYAFRQSPCSDSRQRRLRRMVVLLNTSIGGSGEGRFYTGPHRKLPFSTQERPTFPNTQRVQRSRRPNGHRTSPREPGTGFVQSYEEVGRADDRIHGLAGEKLRQEDEGSGSPP